jgi:hypothetical protein
MKLWISWCLLLALAGSCSALDREAFTFTNYDLQVRIEPEQQRIGVRGTIALRNDSQTPQKNAVLQISSSLTWRSIQADAKPLQFVSQPYESDVDHTGELSEAIVALPKEIPPGGAVELTIGYEGVIVLDASRLTRIGVRKEQAIHSDWDQIDAHWTAVRGAGNVAWYPVATESANLSDGNSLFETLDRWKKREQTAGMKIEFIHTHENVGGGALTLLCSQEGRRLLEYMSRTQGEVTDCHFAPLGLRTPVFALGDYQILEAPALLVAYRPEHKSKAEKFVQAAADAMPFATDWFGAPREKAQVVELMDPGASPYEGGSLLLTPFGDTDPKLIQIALVHDLTHACFPSNRSWIYEGLAHFAQAAYRERQGNRQAALDFLGLHRAAVVDAEKVVGSRPKDAAHPEESLVSTTVDEFFRSKAAYVWWMLRDMLGDEALKKALASYRADHDTREDFMPRLLQAQSKRDLQWFFDDWIYRDRGLPDFRIESAFWRQTSEGNYLVTTTVENLGDAGAEVPVTAHFEGGDLSERVEVRGRSKTVVRISTPKPPTEIVVNDGSVPESDMGNNTFKVEASKR